MAIGIVGVGHLAAAMIAGLVRSGGDSRILLSPRGKARELAGLYGLDVCADNRELVERADIVILAVRPADAPAALEGLPWRAGQVVISVCAGVALSQFPKIAARIVRAMPLTATEINASPTVFYPDIPEARGLISHLGPAIALGSEDEFEVATVNAAIYGWAQDIVRQSVIWGRDHGADEGMMRQLVARTFVAAGRMIAESPEPMERILKDLVTPGGITELGLSVLDQHGQPAAWQAACDAVLARLTTAAKT
ncbi:NAD(P)-binding domain-containing protein [Neorhizobium sp. NCHU2750]|uniref:NAD(P)-binding domain-containing protein n=1 Tax=Neorhizobium sp. NCHU2750 TaxID=1825976 RepID=UPI000E727573|nr:pyrroline-5-carboxylate reductase [Neorhizobium sp. NCHU2750]